MKLKAASRLCDYTTVCENVECESKNDYSEKEILTQLLYGMKNKDHQERVLSQDKLTLEKVLMMVESLEMAAESRAELEGTTKGEIAALRTDHNKNKFCQKTSNREEERGRRCGCC